MPRPRVTPLAEGYNKIMTTTKHTCQGQRRQFRRGVFGVFRCMRKATTIVETQVGYTKHHYACNDPDCFSSIACGYPASSKPIAK